MAIVWDREVYCSPTDAEFNFGPGRTRVRYARHWQVLSNDINDGPVTVCNAPSLPRPYSLYYFGNESDILALLTKIRPERNDKQPLLWSIHLGYEQIPGLQDPETPGEVNLTHYTPHVRIFPVFYEEVIMQARKGEAPNYTWNPSGDKVAVKNSADDFFKPFLKQIVAYTGVEIRENKWWYSLATAKDYMNKVNTDTFWGQAAGTVRMMTIGGVLKAVRDQLYWERACEFHIKNHWGIDRADYGMHVFCASDGKVDCSVGSIAGKRRPVDPIGQEKTEPVFLDGQGNALDEGADPIIYRWFPDDGAIFGDLNLPDPEDLAIDLTP